MAEKNGKEVNLSKVALKGLLAGAILGGIGFVIGGAGSFIPGVSEDIYGALGLFIGLGWAVYDSM
ncbi:MAG TPA: hypothetical protein ENH95_02970 [Nitrosopumilus sp.]|nr:hypothetical protein [Nitrosopumilus sp.]